MTGLLAARRGKLPLSRPSRQCGRCTHANFLKRALIHTGGFNIPLIIRQLIGVGTPRGLQGRVGAVNALLIGVAEPFALIRASRPFRPFLLTIAHGGATHPAALVVSSSAAATCTGLLGPKDPPELGQTKPSLGRCD